MERLRPEGMRREARGREGGRSPRPVQHSANEKGQAQAETLDVQRERKDLEPTSGVLFLIIKGEDKDATKGTGDFLKLISHEQNGIPFQQ